MEPECSLLSLQEPNAGPYSEQHKSGQHLSTLFLFKIHFYIILPSMPGIPSGLFSSSRALL
jgi:hypothetical protein